MMKTVYTVCLILTAVLLMRVNCVKAVGFEQLVRRNVPNGYSLQTFIEVCESCGDLFRKEFTYHCLADKSGTTFKSCYTAVREK